MDGYSAERLSNIVVRGERITVEFFLFNGRIVSISPTTSIRERRLTVNSVSSQSRLRAFWPLGPKTKNPAEFERVHLPDDGQEFLKSSKDMLIQELDEVSGTEQKEAAAHFRAGEERFRDWQYRDAARRYRVSFEVFETLSALLARGVALMMVSELKEAAGVFEEGRNLSMQRASGRFEAAFGINLGQVYNDLGEPKRSRDVLEDARDLSAEIDQPALEAMALRHLGTTLLTQSMYDDAIATCEEAIQLSMEIGDEKSVGHILCNKAVFLASRGNLNESEEIFQQCLKLGRETEDPYVLGRVHTNVANLELIRGNVNDATATLEKALDIHRGINYSQGEARNLGMLAIVKIGEGKLADGYQKFEQAVRIDRESGYRRGEAGLLLMVAGIYLQNNQQQRAYELFQLACKTAGDIHLRYIHIDASAMVTLLMSDIQIEDRISKLEDAIGLSRSVPNPVLEIGISRRLSLLLFDSGRFSEAIALAQQALAFSQEIGNSIEEAKALMNIALIYEQQGETDIAEENASIAHAIFQSQRFVLA